jgi:hypothetical protein
MATHRHYLTDYLAVAIFFVLLVSMPLAHCADLPQSPDDVIRRLVEEFLDRRIVSMTFTSQEVRDHQPYNGSSGRLTYARFSETFFAEALITWVPPRTDGNNEAYPAIPIANRYVQLFKESGKPCLNLEFSVDSKSSHKFLKSVIVRSDLSDDRVHDMIAEEACVRPFVRKFNNLPDSIFDISQKPFQNRSVSKDVTEFTYDTVYGRFMITVGRVDDRDVVQRVILKQSRDDVYSYRNPKVRLSDKTHPVLKDSTGGLTESVVEIVVRYESDVTGPRLRSISIGEMLASAQSRWEMKTILQIINSQTITDDTPIRAMVVKVPNNTKVLTDHKDLINTNLTYVDGEVVRRVDGASLEKVVHEVQSNHRLSRLLWCLFGTASLAVLILIGRRLIRRGRSSP